jgi:hypothetical protein
MNCVQGVNNDLGPCPIVPLSLETGFQNDNRWLFPNAGSNDLDHLLPVIDRFIPFGKCWKSDAHVVHFSHCFLIVFTFICSPREHTLLPRGFRTPQSLLSRLRSEFYSLWVVSMLRVLTIYLCSPANLYRVQIFFKKEQGKERCTHQRISKFFRGNRCVCAARIVCSLCTRSVECAPVPTTISYR